MKFKNFLAGALTLALTAAFLPANVSAETMKVAEVKLGAETERLSYVSSEGNIMAVGSDTDIALPNSVVVEKFGDFSYYEQKDGTLCITDYSDTEENIVFPSEIKGKTVTYVRIQDDTYKNHVSVKIPASVTKVDISLFSLNSKLKSIIVDENNKNYASKDGILFNKDFTELVRYPSGKSVEEPEYTLPDTVKTIISSGFFCTEMTAVNATENNTAFSSLDGVLLSKDKTEFVLYPTCKTGKEYTIPETVTYINYSAFVLCFELETVILPVGLKTIKEHAFSQCENITSLVIPSTVTEIETGAFSYMSGLENMFVDINNSNYRDNEGILFSKDETVLVLYPPKKSVASYTIPNTVEIVGKNAFAYAEIGEVIFGKNVSVIESSAFNMSGRYSGKWDESFTSVILPDSIKTIESFAFANCRQLASVTIPAGLERLSNVTMDTDNYNGMMNYVNFSTNAFYNTSDNLVIHGTPGTVSEKYAIFWGIQFNANPVLSDDKNDTGVNVMLPEGAVPADTALNVEKTTSEDYPDAVVYNISLVSGGKPIQPSAKVSVRIPIPEGASGSDFRVYYRDENGKLTDMKAVVSGNYIVFTTDHFSKYIVTIEQLIPDAITGDVNNDKSVNDRDSISLDRYLGDWDIEIFLEAADMNGDGKVNDQDSIILARTLAGWYE